VTVLELHFLIEVGRLKLRPSSRVAEILDDDRWLLDDPPSANLFERASQEGWTRDPFDRLLVGHAKLRGWKLATADHVLLEKLGPGDVLAL
jgi:PIN domain nuclease of toxin-antitoxin system